MSAELSFLLMFLLEKKRGQAVLFSFQKEMTIKNIGWHLVFSNCFFGHRPIQWKEQKKTFIRIRQKYRYMITRVNNTWKLNNTQWGEIIS